MLNYVLSGDPGDPTLMPILHYFSKGDLEDVKRLWTSYLLSLAKTLGVDCPTLSLEDSDIGKTVKIGGEERKINLADVRYSYTKITAKTKGNLYHGLFYQNRDYLIDFAKYSNQHPDCNIPDDLFLSYSNRGRSYGLFRKLKALEDCMRKRKEKEMRGLKSDTDESDIFGNDGFECNGKSDADEEKNTDQACRLLWDRVCPLCGKKMSYIGEIKYISQLPMNMRSLDYDYKEGKRIKTTFCRDEIAWYCSPLMFELGEDDPEYKRLHENDLI